ncbi:hypothetical protein ACSRUE_21325 [Sorangium sp. KYC3313]|uniref:hypothetical protein n=1 Tax=Sorangium sp. KYC3313 TaxID=3449740 RepID=UPI003F8C419E
MGQAATQTERPYVGRRRLPARARDDLHAQLDAVARRHKKVLARTTMISTHIIDRGLLGVISPLDR